MLTLLLKGVTPELWQCWNVGHVMEVLRQIFKATWLPGLRCLFSNRRVQVLFRSVNDASNFCAILDAFILLLLKEDSLEAVKVFLKAICQEPYKLWAIFIYQYFTKDKISQEATRLVDQLKRESVIFFEKELDDIFERFDPKGLFPN